MILGKWFLLYILEWQKSQRKHQEANKNKFPHCYTTHKSFYFTFSNRKEKDLKLLQTKLFKNCFSSSLPIFRFFVVVSLMLQKHFEKQKQQKSIIRKEMVEQNILLSISLIKLWFMLQQWWCMSIFQNGNYITLLSFATTCCNKRYKFSYLKWNIVFDYQANHIV